MITEGRPPWSVDNVNIINDKTYLNEMSHQLATHCFKRSGQDYDPFHYMWRPEYTWNFIAN